MNEKKATLDLQGVRDQLNGLYDEVKGKANFLIYGKKGVGKTCLAPTCPAPVLLHSFDPGGWRVAQVREAVEAGKVMVDNRYENDNVMAPFAYNAWKDEINRLAKAGIFDQLGTYFLDSGTMWAQAVMNEIQKKKGNLGKSPELQQYAQQQSVVADMIGNLLALPCHFILTGHVEMMKDEVDGQIHTSLMATGKLKIKLPLLFDEYYYMVAKGTADGKKVDRYLMTVPDTRHDAATRIGSTLFAPQEQPNIRELLKKAGYRYEDVG